MLKKHELSKVRVEHTRLVRHGKYHMGRLEVMFSKTLEICSNEAMTNIGTKIPRDQ